MEYRSEYDLLGKKDIPKEAYWGIHTQRARDNFKLSGYPVSTSLISALAMVKKACCLSNHELGYIAADKSRAIVSACDRIISGDLKEQFVTDALQGGAGTSTNMNLNEVIANLAIKALGGEKGDYTIVHPINEVNLHQSTNDTYPTALKIAILYKLEELSRSIEGVQGAFQRKESEFSDIVKSGRTEMQEAIPFTLGLEFSAFAEAFSRDRWRTFKCRERLRVVNIGGTAIGTGLTAPRSYIFLVIEKIREITGLNLARGENLIDSTANSDAFVEVSGILKAHAVNLIKICGDLRRMHFLGEIKLPPSQSGSSIMPGKINPVIMEAVIQSGIKIVANDLIVSETCSRSTFQINEFMPLLSFAFLESLDILINANVMLAAQIEGIAADSLRCGAALDNSLMVMTAFLPILGYARACDLVREFKDSKDSNILEFLERKLGRQKVKEILSPDNLRSLGYKDDAKNT